MLFTSERNWVGNLQKKQQAMNCQIKFLLLSRDNGKEYSPTLTNRMWQKRDKIDVGIFQHLLLYQMEQCEEKMLFNFFWDKNYHIRTTIFNEFLKSFSCTKIPPSLIRNYQQMVITKKAKQLSQFLWFVIRLLLHTFECNASRLSMKEILRICKIHRFTSCKNG